MHFSFFIYCQNIKWLAHFSLLWVVYSFIFLYSLLAQSLVIKQKVEWGDVLVGYEQANQYTVYIPNKDGSVDKSANPIYRV